MFLPRSHSNFVNASSVSQSNWIPCIVSQSIFIPPPSEQRIRVFPSVLWEYNTPFIIFIFEPLSKFTTAFICIVLSYIFSVHPLFTSIDQFQQHPGHDLPAIIATPLPYSFPPSQNADETTFPAVSIPPFEILIFGQVVLSIISISLL